MTLGFSVHSNVERPFGVEIIGLNRQEFDQLLGSIILTTGH